MKINRNMEELFNQRIKIYNDDCLNVIKTIEPNSVDIIITSPPYNVDLGNNKLNKNPYNLYNDNKEHNDYINWLKNIFGDCYNVLCDSGRVCINIGDGKNGRVPTHSDIIHFMTKELNYIPYSTIIWNKFQIGSRTAWGSFNSPSLPSFPTQFEYILIFAKGSTKLQKKGISDLTKENFIHWTNSMWTFAPQTQQKKIGHPAMFPTELPKRCMQMLSWEDAIVLDPFMGSGTTGIAAIENNRRFIGIELDEKYYNLSKSRINEAIFKKETELGF